MGIEDEGNSQVIVFFSLCKVIGHSSRAPREEIETGGGPDAPWEKVGLPIGPLTVGHDLPRLGIQAFLSTHPSKIHVGVRPIIKHLWGSQCRPPSMHRFVYLVYIYIYICWPNMSITIYGCRRTGLRMWPRVVRKKARFTISRGHGFVVPMSRKNRWLVADKPVEVWEITGWSSKLKEIYRSF